MKRIFIPLLCLMLSLSGCEHQEKPPITVSPSSETVSSEPVSSESIVSSAPEAPKPPPKKEAELITQYIPFPADFAIADSAPNKKRDEDLERKIAAGELVKLEDGACLDLDGDGKGEVIRLAVVKEKTDEEKAESQPEAEPDTVPDDVKYIQLTVGNRRIEIESQAPNGDLYAGRLAKSGSIQLLTTENDFNDDSYTYFFEYQKSGIWQLGGCEGHPDGFTRTSGGFTSSTRAGVLQAWRYPQEYVISSGDVLSTGEGQYIPSCVTPVPLGTYSMGTIVRLKRNLPLLAAPSIDSDASYALPFNKLAALTASDNSEWVYITTVEPNPRGGWLQIKAGSFSICLVNGEEIDAAQLFDGLMNTR